MNLSFSNQQRYINAKQNWTHERHVLFWTNYPGKKPQTVCRKELKKNWNRRKEKCAYRGKRSVKVKRQQQDLFSESLQSSKGLGKTSLDKSLCKISLRDPWQALYKSSLGKIYAKSLYKVSHNRCPGKISVQDLYKRLCEISLRFLNKSSARGLLARSLFKLPIRGLLARCLYDISRFARACLVEMHMDTSQEPFYAEIYRKNAAGHRFVRDVLENRRWGHFCAVRVIRNPARVWYHLDWTPGFNPNRKNPFSVATLLGE